MDGAATKFTRSRACVLAAWLILAAPVFAQHEHQQAPPKKAESGEAAQPGHAGHGQAHGGPRQAHGGHATMAESQAHGGHATMAENPVGAYLLQQASGTGFNPGSSPTHMFMGNLGSWTTMLHGQAFVNDVQQAGARGGDKFFSTNWVMGAAEHRAGRNGSVMVRTMLSLEPATITRQRYPELFQTGETAFGRPIVDGQHPHDLFMELSLQYAHQLGERTILDLYVAPVGEPALGPIAFPHRVSAQELPQATLGHHVQDSTHIATEVVTGAVRHGRFQWELSGFHGREPNENRWNIDRGGIDSWSTRLSMRPGANWYAQASLGRLHGPEALEPGDIVRSTASVAYNRPMGNGNWASSLVWGRNHKTATRQNVNSYLAESLYSFGRNHVTGRMELLDREELAHGDERMEQILGEGRVFRIAAYTLGYVRDVKLFPKLQTGIGGNFTVYTIPSELTRFYGQRPAAVCVFVRFRLGHAM